jgi:hypothetical protein
MFLLTTDSAGPLQQVRVWVKAVCWRHVSCLCVFQKSQEKARSVHTWLG